MMVLLGLTGTVVGADLASAERLYQNGDFTAAFSEFRTLAETGVAVAQVRLGEMYRDGKGVPRDQLEYAHWFWEAAKNGRQDAARVMGWPIQPGSRPRLECVRLVHPQEDLTIDIKLHNTRMFVESMILHAENYTAGFEPLRPNLEIHVYRIEDAARTEVPAHVASLGGGPYGEEARRISQRNTGIFDETAPVFLTFPASEAWIQEFRAEVDKAPARLRENFQKVDSSDLARYFSFPLPAQVGSYEVVAEYQSRDTRFWPDRLTASCSFDVKTVPEFPKQ
jgi:hypothetical protein